MKPPQSPAAPSAAPALTREQSKALLKGANVESFIQTFEATGDPAKRRNILIKLLNQNNQLIDTHFQNAQILADNNRTITVYMEQMKSKMITIKKLHKTVDSKDKDYQILYKKYNHLKKYKKTATSDRKCYLGTIFILMFFMIITICYIISPETFERFEL